MKDKLELYKSCTTVKDAAKYILEEIKNQKDFNKFLNTKEEDLVGYHFTLGMSIRNSFGLWENNKKLLKDTGKEHPDDASNVIIKETWKLAHKKIKDNIND